MRTLKQITDAVRRNESVSYPEMRFALVAYDVLLAKMNISQDKHMVAEFFKAAESCPKEYVGPENDPENPEFVKWHTEHINNRPEVFDMARELLDECPHCLDEMPFDVSCYADRDGDCNHEGCPQLRDGEPLKTGRHCPLDT